MSWLPIPPTSHFSLANIPFGIITTPSDQTKRPAIAIGDHALDLKAFSLSGGFAPSPAIETHASVFTHESLNAFAALGRPFHRLVRAYLQDVFRSDTPAELARVLRDDEPLRRAALVPRTGVRSHLPLVVGDYTDFYAGRNHAYNVGVLFRGEAHALPANYTHLPAAYHGRASSVVVSGTPIRRPWGQILGSGDGASTTAPVLSPTRKLDLELEMGVFLCGGNPLGRPVGVADADEHVFGYVLLNDWSARDVQAWEYVPLGPFTAKNFGTSISPWVVLADAVAGFKTGGLRNESSLLAYLDGGDAACLDVELEVEIETPAGIKTTITKANAKYLLWSWPQIIAHHTITGCNLRTGDLLGSGTISGDVPGSEGSLLEQTHGGKTPVRLGGGEERLFLQDGDTVTIRGWAGRVGEGGGLVGFGEVTGRVEPALNLIPDQVRKEGGGEKRQEEKKVERWGTTRAVL